MALTDDSMVMPVAPMYGGNGGGFGGFGGDSWLGILFLIALCNGGWGGFGGFGGGFGGYGNMMLGYDFPWLLNGQNGINSNVNDGFRSAQISDSITSVREGVNNLATQLCGCCGDVQMAIAGTNQNISNGTAAIQNSLCQGFAGATAAVTGAQNAIAQQLYSNQLADLERSFAAQTASTQGMNALQSQLAQCCCDNRAATADLKYTIATENCADRAALSDGIRDIIASNTAQTQTILDKLCALELDGYKRENDNLRSQLNMANLAASQTAQTAQILAGQTAEIDGVYNRLKNCPVPSMPVYGNTPIFTCNNGNTCGCGCGA